MRVALEDLRSPIERIARLVPASLERIAPERAAGFEPKARKAGCRTNVYIPLTRSCPFICREDRGSRLGNQYHFFERDDLRSSDQS
jgi:hypothetical protein